MPTPALICISNLKMDASRLESPSVVITKTSMINWIVGARVHCSIAVRVAAEQQLRRLANFRDIQRAAQGANPVVVHEANAEIINFDEIKRIGRPH